MVILFFILLVSGAGCEAGEKIFCVPPYISYLYIRSHTLVRTKIIMSLLNCFDSYHNNLCIKSSEYDQEIPESHTEDQPMAPRGRTKEN